MGAKEKEKKHDSIEDIEMDTDHGAPSLRDCTPYCPFNDESRLQLNERNAIPKRSSLLIRVLFHFTYLSSPLDRDFDRIQSEERPLKGEL